jgi:NitT/TauT family transport system permease protein
LSTAPSRETRSGAVSERHALFLRTLRRRQILVVAIQLLILVGFVALWQIAVSLGFVDPFIVSQPAAIMQKVAELTNDGTLGYHIAVTVGETLAGFALGTVLGIVIAAMLWWWDFLSDV